MPEPAQIAVQILAGDAVERTHEALELAVAAVGGLNVVAASRAFAGQQTDELGGTHSGLYSGVPTFSWSGEIESGVATLLRSDKNPPAPLMDR